MYKAAKLKKFKRKMKNPAIDFLSFKRKVVAGIFKIFYTNYLFQPKEFEHREIEEEKKKKSRRR